MYHINYITTNNNNGKQYVGKHSTEDLNDGYLGSGITLKRAIKKYGKENFTTEILLESQTEKQARKYESYFIMIYNTLYPNGYNIDKRGGKNSGQKLGEKRTDEIKEKIGNSVRGEKNGMYGKTHTIEARNKMREAATGRKSWCKGLTKETDERVKQVSEKLKGIKRNPECYRGEKNGMYGKKMSEESKKKMSDARRGKPIPKLQGRIPWNKGLTKDTDERVINKSKGVPRPELKGVLRPELKGKAPWNKGLTKETDERVAQYVNTGINNRKLNK